MFEKCLARLIPAAAMAAVLASCATNPVTGERQLALISESQEISLGREAAQEAEASIGLVDDPDLQQYVERVGMALAKTSERPALPWRFAVVDDPTPNAFALPGGFIYVTRGMVNLMDSEAELASVLGHEIGHVTARHAVTMVSRQQLTELGLGLGGVLFPDIQPATQALGAGLQLLYLRYGRDAERQADELGFAYARGHGYAMSEMADVFVALQQAAKLEQQSPLPSWLASHPAPAERIEAIRERVAAAGPQTSARVGRAEYLQRIDGLVFGVNPRHGFFRENVFYHPDLRFRLSVPDGWQQGNFPQAVVAASPDGRAVVQLTLVPEGDPGQAAQRFFAQQGIQSGGAEQQRVNGLPAIVSRFRAQTQQGVVDGYVVYLAHRGQTYQLLSYVAPGVGLAGYQNALLASVGSFAPVTSGDVLNVQPRRIDIVKLPRPQSLAAFNESQPSSVALPTLALLNQVPEPSARLEAGTLVKRVVGGSGS
jgi:predicted Zn-dependent protease